MFVGNSKTTSYNQGGHPQGRHPPDAKVRASPAHLQTLNSNGKEWKEAAMNSACITTSPPFKRLHPFWDERL
jgi:hypothetical protein